MNEILTAKITCSSDSEELIKIAKKKGIVLPSDHLGAFKTVYARIGDANRNKVRLSREAVEEALPTLIGSQVNINHWRENWTVGSIFWAKVNDNDEIEIAFTFFKDVYKKEHEIAMALFEDEELTVSFELTANPDTVEFHADGTRTLNDVSFVGCGLLLDENPAEPTAIVFEMAKRRVMELIRNDTPELVFAKEAVINCQDLLETINKALEEKSKESYDCQCLDCDKVIKSAKHCKDIKCPECGGKMRRKDRPGPGNQATKNEESNTTLDLSKGTNKNKEEVSDINIDEDFEEGGNQMKKDEKKKVEDVKAEETSQEAVEEKDESKVDEKAEESTDEKAEESTEEKAEESTEEKAEEAKLEVITETNEVVTETMDENSDTVKIESETKQTVERDGEQVSEMTEKVDVERTYTFAEVEEIKAGYEATIEAMKSSFEAEVEVAKDKAIKIEKLQTELGEYVKDFSDEDFDNDDKLDNARLRKENDSLKKVKPVVETTSEEASENEEKVETASLETAHEENSASKGSALVEVLKGKNK